MANGYSQFNLNINTTTNLNGVNQLRQQLQELRMLAKNIDFTGTMNPTQINQMITAAKELDGALEAAFDANLNTVNIQKFNQYLKDSKTSLSSIQAGLSQAGVTGQQAFINATNQLLRFNTTVRQTTGFLHQMKTSFLSSLKWTVMYSSIYAIGDAVKDAYSYVKDLDSALNDIRIVTGKSSEQMQKFAVEANNAAKALAVSTKDYTQGALIYYQQGLDDETVTTLTEITAKTANVTKQSMETVSEQLTAVWNGYQVANEAAKEGMQVYEEYIDKMAAVGATTASNLEELSTAMSKVASAASSMGVGFDELNAQIATIVSVTRQAPESIGTALKTIYARLGDLQVDGVDEFGTKLGDVSGKLQMMGIDILDANGDMREMDDVMTEVAEKWDTWTEAQRQAAAVAMAGKRQYNNLIALFDNWDMYTDTLKTAQNAAGTLNEQQSTALDSLDNKLDILTATAQDFYDNLFDEESLKDLVEDLTKIMQGISDVTESIGGLKSILPLIGSLLLNVFGKNIANGLLNFKNNLAKAKLEAQDTSTALATMQTLFPKHNFGNADAMSKGVGDMVGFYNKMLPLKQYMNKEDEEAYNNILQQKAEVANLNVELEKQIKNYRTREQAQSGFKVGKPGMGAGIVKDNNAASGFSTKSLETELAKYDSALQNFETKINGVKSQLNGLSTKDAKAQVESFFAALKKSGSNINETALKNLNKEINTFIGDSGRVSPDKLEKIKQVLSNFAEPERQLVRVNNEINKLGKGAKTAGDSLEQNLKFKQMVTNTTSALSAVGQLASAFQTLKNLGSIWENEDLDNGEKMLQTIINLGFALPMLITSFTSLGKSLGINAALTTFWSTASASASAGTSVWTAAQMGLNAAMSANPIGLIILAIVALIAIIAGAITIYDKMTVTAEEAAESAAKSQEQIQESFKATKEAYDNLMSSIESYNEAQTAINKLTEGTQEWRDAIRDANEQVIELIDKYPELANAVERVEGGRLIFNDEKASEVLRAQEEEFAKAERANYYASIRKKETQDFLKMQELGQDIKYWTTNEVQYTAGGTQVQSFVNAGDMQKVIDALNSSSAEIFESNQALKEATGISNDNLIQALMNNKTEIIELANVIDANTKANQLLLEESARSKLENSEFADLYETSQYQEQVSALVANASKNAYDDQYKVAKDKDNFWNDKELLDAYAELTGYTVEKDKWGEGVFKDKQGKEITVDNEAMIEALATEYSIDVAVGNANKFIQDMQVLSSTGVQAGLEAGLSMTDSSELGDMLAGFLGGEGSIATATIEQKEALEEAMKSTDFSTLISEETLKAAGYETVSEFMSAVEIELENYNEEEAAALRKQKQLQEYNTSISATASSLEVSETALKGYTDALIDNNELLEENSTVAVDAAAANISFAKGISSLQEALEDNLDILKEWNEDAFETYEAAEQVQNAIKEMFGVEVSADFVKENLDDLQKAIEGDEEAIDRLSKAAAKDFIVGLQLDESGTNAFNDIIDQLSNTDISIGAEVDLGNSIDTINELLAAGQITAEQVNAAFESIGYKPNIEYTTQKGKPTTTTTVSAVNYKTPWADENSDGKNLGTITTTNTSVSDISVPYITSGGTASKGEGGYGVKNSGTSATKITTKSARAGSIGSIATNAKKDKEKNTKKLNDEYDRYWDLNNTLEDTTKAVEALDEAQQHLHGDALIDSLTEENELLQNQKEAYEAIREEQLLEAQELRNQLKNYGFSFEDGLITNYKDATNQLVNALNSGTIDEDTYEKVKLNLERYDELVYDEMVETAKNIQDTALKQAENNLEGWETKVEMNLDTTQAERDLEEFNKTMSENFKSTTEDLQSNLNSIFSNYETYIRPNTGTLDVNLQAIRDVEAEIDKMQTEGKNYDFSTGMFASVGNAQEKLKELRETLIDDATTVKELWQDAWDTYMDGIDQAADSFDDLGDKFDRINDELDYQKELIELIYGPEAYAMQSQIFDAQRQNSLAQIDSAKQQVALWQKYYDEATDNEEDKLKYQELLQEAQANLNELTLEHIKLLKDEYASSVENILSTLDKDLSGGMGLDRMTEEWERALEESEKYYDSVDRIYQLETLEGKFQKAIDDTADPKYQQAIRDLMEDQLGTLEDKEKLTEYDVQLAEKRLGILQAEAALEDAQNAKNAMKLVRGATGNWEYQYVADTSDVEAKQQDLRDAYQELHEFTKEAHTESIEALLDAKKEYLEAMREIATDETLTEEEKQLRMSEIHNRYWNETDGIMIQLQNDFNNKREEVSKATAEVLLGYYEADEDAYLKMTDEEKKFIDEFKGHVDETYDKMYFAIGEAYEEDQEKFDEYLKKHSEPWQTAASQMADAWNADNGESVKNKVQQAYDAILKKSDEYLIKIGELEEVSGDKFGEDGIAGDIDTVTGKVKDLNTETEKLITNITDNLPNYKSAVEQMGTSWNNVYEQIKTAKEELDEYLKKVEIAQEVDLDKSGDGSGTQGGGDGGYKGNKNPNETSPTVTDGSGVQLTSKWNNAEWASAKIFDTGDTKIKFAGSENNLKKGMYVNRYAGQIKYIETDNGNYKILTYPGAEGYVTMADLIAIGVKFADPTISGRTAYNAHDQRDYLNTRFTYFDTGGYTGNWSGGEGRMAMLHSKELVLNKADTENILNAVSAVRDMAGITGSVGSAIMQNIKSMLAEVLGISAGTGHTTRSTNSETSNVFNITAEFPNANDVTSIREAILSLPNLASQYIAQNRK